MIEIKWELIPGPDNIDRASANYGNLYMRHFPVKPDYHNAKMPHCWVVALKLPKDWIIVATGYSLGGAAAARMCEFCAIEFLTALEL